MNLPRPLDLLPGARSIAGTFLTIFAAIAWPRRRRVPINRADFFELVAAVADGVARHLVGEPKELARVLAPAARAASYLIAAGFDPSFEIARALERDPAIRIARAEYLGMPTETA